MKKNLNIVIKKVAALALVVALVSSSTVVNAATASKRINDTYGIITGKVFGVMAPTGKYFESSAGTTKKVPNLYAELEIQVNSTGKKITSKSTGWQKDTKHTAIYEYMDSYKKDGYRSTKLAAYGCAEALVKKTYTVYTSCVY